MRTHFIFLAFGAAMLVGTSAQAQEDPEDGVDTPAVIDQMFQCREVEDPEARLACFDREVGRVYEAQASRELVIADREQVEKTKRGLFGLRLPKIGLFSGDDDKERVNEITATLASAQKRSNGMYIFELEDGARWLQTESISGFQRYKAGDTIVIKQAALGSFKAKVNGKRAMRVRRLN